MTDQYDRQFFPESFPVPTRTTATTAPNVSTGAAAQAVTDGGFFTIPDDTEEDENDVLTEQELTFHTEGDTW